MLVDTDAMVPMRQANQNFSAVAKMAEEKGAVLILKNNKPHLIVMPCYDVESTDEVPSDELVEQMYRQFADKYRDALSELAK